MLEESLNTSTIFFRKLINKSFEMLSILPKFSEISDLQKQLKNLNYLINKNQNWVKINPICREYIY